MKAYSWTREELNQLYTIEKKTTKEIARILGCHYCTVQKALKRHKIPRRIGAVIKRGLNHHKWKGESAALITYHQRLNRLFGKPRYCEHCSTKTAKYYDWANDTGNYHDPYDYIRLCRKCHRNFDQDKKRKDRHG